MYSNRFEGLIKEERVSPASELVQVPDEEVSKEDALVSYQ